MRLLQVMASDKTGGAELFFGRMCGALQERGLSQRALIRRGAVCRDDLLAAGVPTLTMPFLANGDILSRWLIRRQIRDFAPDILLSWMSRAATLCPTSRQFVHVARLGGYYKMKYFRHCDHLVGNTQHIVSYIRDHGWPAERVHYLPNFVDERPATAVRRDSLATPEGVPLLLALGRLHSDKAFDILLAAMARLPDAHLWLAGEGPLLGPLKAQSDALGIAGRIRFLGWRDDAQSLLEAADILVCPSRVEPLGNVILEAWVHRTPVVAAASTGPAGLITDGVDGLLVPMEDAGALAGAVSTVIRDGGLAEKLAQGGRLTYESRFSRPAVVDRYLQFFAKVAR
ncbi:MAG TPA: glycosyltransferase [Rhodospirillaceae bacterium]|nr:glycosyltransferase [Rhodospirillaceae bacterium]